MATMVAEVRQIALSMVSRPWQTLSTSLGALLGVAAFTATLGLGMTGRAQVGEAFDQLKATEVRAYSVGQSQEATPAEVNPLIEAEARDDRLRQLPGVLAAGTRQDLGQGLGVALREVDEVADITSPHTPAPIMAVSPGYFRATEASTSSGRVFDYGHMERGDHVAVIGAGLARQLGVSGADGTQAIFVGDEPYVLLGIVSDVSRDPDMLLSVMLPTLPQKDPLRENAAPSQYLLSTDIGAASVVGRQVPLTLSPTAPLSYSVVVPPEPAQLRADVGLRVDGITLALSVMSLGLGAITIGNTVAASVHQRASEIGLRRALGARRRNIAQLFLGESAGVGLLGGTFGTALGVVVVASISIERRWEPVLDPPLLLLGPCIGLLSGLLAGAYPAIKAARMAPAVALSQ